MMQIKIADTQFAHGTSFGSGDLKIYPKHFQWYRGQDNISDIIVITESMFHKYDEFPEKIKLAWLLEPKSISPNSYNTIIEKWWKFDYVLTHNFEFIKLLQKLKDEFQGSYRCDTKFIWYPFGGCWIMPEDRKIYPKTKLISIIASGKNETEGHLLRHQVILALNMLKSSMAGIYNPDKIILDIGIYGRGYNPVDYKLDALKDYQYSIVIENEMTDGWFTEKLIDCWVTGTVPIYWGKKSPLFPVGSTINFETIEQLRGIVENILNNPDRNIETQYLEANLKFSEQFACPEDWLYNNFFMKEEVLKNQLVKFNIL